jgi:hypothetical protein
MALYLTPSKEKPNKLVVWSATSSDDKKTSCTQAKRRAIEPTIKGRMVHNTFNYMVDNESMEGPLLLATVEGGDDGQWKEGEGSGPTMDEGLPNMEVQYDLFQKIAELKRELATSRAFVEEYKAKVERLKEDLKAQKSMVSRLSGNIC